MAGDKVLIMKIKLGQQYNYSFVGKDNNEVTMGVEVTWLPEKPEITTCYVKSAKNPNGRGFKVKMEDLQPFNEALHNTGKNKVASKKTNKAVKVKTYETRDDSTMKGFRVDDTVTTGDTDTIYTVKALFDNMAVIQAGSAILTVKQDDITHYKPIEVEPETVSPDKYNELKAEVTELRAELRAVLQLLKANTPPVKAETFTAASYKGDRVSIVSHTDNKAVIQHDGRKKTVSMESLTCFI